MRWGARLPVMLAAALLAALGLAVPASAVACSYDAPSLTVTVDVADGETATVARSGDAISLNGAPCGTATVSNTDTIRIGSTATPAEVAIDESGGLFEPGATPESGGDSESEFAVDLPNGRPTLRIVGAADADHIVVGDGGINLNADETSGDVDVTITGLPTIAIQGAGGDDVLSGFGGSGTGSAVATTTLSLDGQAGDDLLVPGLGGTTLGGGDGTDTLDLSAAASGIAVDLGAGTATHDGATDQVEAIENITGSAFDDEITGDDADNGLDGGSGDDVIDGAGGDDTLIGGDGENTVSFASSTKRVTVDLRKGTAEGDGADTLDGFENVIGGRKADAITGTKGPNTLDGAGGGDEIDGRDGADLLLGGDGNDLLLGGNGNDLLRGGAGRDQLDGGKGKHDICKGESDPDAFVNCENYAT